MWNAFSTVLTAILEASRSIKVNVKAVLNVRCLLFKKGKEGKRERGKRKEEEEKAKRNDGR